MIPFIWLRHPVYTWQQYRQSRAKRRKDVTWRAERNLALIREYATVGRQATILSIGSRNESELATFGQWGYARVTYIDLFPWSPGIQRIDMHAMNFPDSAFDLVYGSHVFEHALDIGRVVAEVARVVRPGGLVFAAFPVGFTPSGHDRVDLASASLFMARFYDWYPEPLLLTEERGEALALFRLHHHADRVLPLQA